MIKVLFLSLRPGYNVINADLYLMMNHIMKQNYHGSLIGCPSVLQSKRHHFVTENAPLHDEGCLLHVLGCHLDLIITRESVHEGEYLMMCGIINQNINVGKQKVIFRACSVQVPIINTHYYLSIFLVHWHDISNPWGI